ncbi:hypothetical protein GOP47_0000885 [Adiantum capillus-veneris]|uniref:Uncharacterized protein n=1 Tax=Adiantum capillus-veneris TaxID=13818 RepID=A0A9D4ZSP9_ADICA|nr:hypothetical protein GOP47_0000885 [Adiantum capillus-veneris]
MYFRRTTKCSTLWLMRDPGDHPYHRYRRVPFYQEAGGYQETKPVSQMPEDGSSGSCMFHSACSETEKCEHPSSTGATLAAPDYRGHPSAACSDWPGH